jgi:hypothetical protein
MAFLSMEKFYIAKRLKGQTYEGFVILRNFRRWKKIRSAVSVVQSYLLRLIKL